MHLSYSLFINSTNDKKLTCMRYVSLWISLEKVQEEKKKKKQKRLLTELEMAAKNPESLHSPKDCSIWLVYVSQKQSMLKLHLCKLIQVSKERLRSLHSQIFHINHIESSASVWRPQTLDTIATIRKLLSLRKITPAEKAWISTAEYLDFRSVRCLLEFQYHSATCKSQNHGKVEVERDLWRSPNPTTLLAQVHQAGFECLQSPSQLPSTAKT